ncbi:MAG: AI-2E family transporter [Verrucomicrobiae bacterium]|nr:AI-2E family transporter [Verrucomicrobiae bacterium]
MLTVFPSRSRLGIRAHLAPRRSPRHTGGVDPHSQLGRRVELYGGLAALGLLLLGCFLVLRPFLSALLWAGILCYATWPGYQGLLRISGGRRALASSLMVALVALVLVVPFVVLGVSLADNVTRAIGALRALISEGLPDPPAWLASLPFAGSDLHRGWTEMAHDREALLQSLRGLLTRSKGFLLAQGVVVGRGVLDLTLSVLIAWFFYRHGELVVRRAGEAGRRIIGERTQRLLEVAGRTVNGVVYGVIGTALAQGILAGIGFWAAGVPAPVLLGMITFFASVIPGGPPLIWIPVVIWIFAQGRPTHGVLLALWGVLAISGIDNVLRPWIVSRGSRLSFILVLLGMLGGLFSFGFIGLFLGPVLLALAHTLLGEWLRRPETAIPVRTPDPRAD